MKEILIFDGKLYRTVTAHNLKVYDGGYKSQTAYIMPNNKECDVFFASDNNKDNLNMLSKLIKLIHDLYLSDSRLGYDACFIDEKVGDITFSHPRELNTSIGGIYEYDYKNEIWEKYSSKKES